MGIDIKKLIIRDIEFYREYQKRYYMHNPPYYKSKHNIHIGQVVEIDNNIGHDTGYKGQLGIVIGISGVDYYTYVISYDSRTNRYYVCGFEESDLCVVNKSIKHDKKLYCEFEKHLIGNEFKICTGDFEDQYKKHLNIRVSKGNVMYVNFT